MEEKTAEEEGNKHKEKNNGQTEKKCLKQGSVRVSKIRMLVQELNRDGLAGVRVGVPVRCHVCHEDGI